MKASKFSKIEACVSKNAYHGVLCQPFIRNVKGKPHLCATDGKHMVILPVTMEEGDTMGHVNIEALKQARKLVCPDDEITIEDNGCIKLQDGRTIPRFGDGLTTPNVEQVMPDPNDVKFTVAFDVALLANIAQAFGTNWVKLQFKDELSPIIVLPNGNKDKKGYAAEAKGVLMPIRTT